MTTSMTGATGCRSRGSYQAHGTPISAAALTAAAARGRSGYGGPVCP